METPSASLLLLGVRVVGIATILAMNLVGGRTFAQATGPELPQGPGRDLVRNICSNCHVLGMVTSSRRTSDDWTEVVNRMAGLGAVMTPDQMGQIHRYLAQHFGPQSNAAVAANGPAFRSPAPPSAPQGQLAAKYPRPTGENQWPAYGGGPMNQNFSPHTQITPRNVSRLRPAWTFHYGVPKHDLGDQGLDFRFEVTPLIIGGVMYISTPMSPMAPTLKSTITALRPESGEVLWKYESPFNIHGRGLAYWPGDATTAPRLVFGTDWGYIMAVDVTTGQLAAGFGNKGQIDAYVGVVSELVGDSRRAFYTIPNPVTIYKNLIIVGARPGEAGPPGPRADIRAFDARTGRLMWTFHTVPQPGEPNHETWVGDEWRDVTGANVWSTMSVDEANGIVYAPVGDINGRFQGPELYATSLLALDAATGKLKWHRQLVHKDMWDWDLPVPPILLDVEHNGRKVPAVLQSGKFGLTFIFNRLTGEPINGYEERPAPKTNVAGVDPWPTQPWPQWPGPISRIKMTRDEIPDLVPGMKDHCTRFWDDNQIVSGDLYSLPLTDRALIRYPTSTGGPNWGGGSYNPQTGFYFINTQNVPRYSPPSAKGDNHMTGRSLRGPGSRREVGPDVPNTRRRGGDDGEGGGQATGFNFRAPSGVTLSCGATPWGELVAVDIPNKRIAWKIPLGRFEALGATGDKAGTRNLGGNITTASGLVFIGASNDRRFRAFDAKTGRKLWETELEASAHSTPISYMGQDGKQYIVVAAGGGTSAGGPTMSDTLVAFRLP